MANETLPTHLLTHLELLSVLSFLCGYAPDIVGKAVILTLGSDRMTELMEQKNA